MILNGFMANHLLRISFGGNTTLSIFGNGSMELAIVLDCVHGGLSDIFVGWL